MVEGLSKRIAGDWSELSQMGLTLDALAGYFVLPPDVVSAVARDVSASVEHGVVEYKEKILQPFFGVLEDMKFKSVAFDELGRQRDGLNKVLLVTMIERLFAAGAIGGVERESASATDTASAEHAAQEDLKVILADVMARVRGEPSLKTHKSVKLILTQLAIYQRERETMEKLLPHIKDPAKAASSRRNFHRTFADISRNIAKHYAQFLEEERRRTEKQDRLDLGALPWKRLLPLLTRESREFLRLRSTLDFALEGKYKVREICVHMYNEKKAFFDLLGEESSALVKLASGNPAGRQIHAALAAETAAALEKMERRGWSVEGPPSS